MNEDRNSPLNRRLKGLPDQKAPAGMLAAVMAAAQARAAMPWYRRPTWSWPQPARLGLAFGLGGAAWGGMTLAVGLGLPLRELGERVNGPLLLLVKAVASAWWAYRLPLGILTAVMAVSTLAAAGLLAQVAGRSLNFRRNHS